MSNTLDHHFNIDENNLQQNDQFIAIYLSAAQKFPTPVKYISVIIF